MASIDDILSAMNNTNVLLGRLIQAIERSFPTEQIATSATAGSIVAPNKVEAYIKFTFQDGTIAKIPYYND